VKRALLVALLLAGCAAPSPAAPPASAPAAAGPFVDWEGCSAWNAFALLDQAAMRPRVPSNWTFTGLAPGLATLRVHLVLCGGDAVLTLSTPMFTDAPSQRFHANPDVVVAAFSSNATTVRGLAALGAQAEAAAFCDTPLPGGAHQVAVTTPAGAVLDAVIVPSGRAGSPYNFTAVYAVPAAPLAWFWGQETAPSQQATANYQLGPASGFGQARLVQYQPQAWWGPFAARYQPGIP
jgi:hypothetical protein